MSDLAPPAAAAEEVTRLQNEVEALQADKKHLEEELARLSINAKLVRVTGPGGFPVYAEGHIGDAVRHTDYGSPCYDLELINSTGKNANSDLPMCPVREIEKAEIHIGNKRMFVLGDFDDTDSLSSMGDMESSLLYVFGGKKKTVVIVEFGPLPDPFRLRARAPYEYRNEDISYVRFKEVQFPDKL